MNLNMTLITKMAKPYLYKVNIEVKCNICGLMFMIVERKCHTMSSLHQPTRYEGILVKGTQTNKQKIIVLQILVLQFLLYNICDPLRYLKIMIMHYDFL